MVRLVGRGAEIGERAFLGNSGMAGPGMHVPKNGLVAVLSAAPRKAKSGSSWLGSPPMRLRRQVPDADLDRTYAPPLRLRIARSLWEVCRIVPVMVTTAIALLVLLTLAWFADTWGLGSADAAALWKGGWGPGADGKYLARQMGQIEIGGSQYAVAIAASVAGGAPGSSEAVDTELAQWLVDNVPELGEPGGC